MIRRRSYASSIAAMQRASVQAERHRIEASRAAERMRRDQERLRSAGGSERPSLLHELRETEAASRNQRLAASAARIESLLHDALGIEHRLDFESLKTPLQLPKFEPGPLAKPEKPPRPQDFLPQEPGFVERLLPRASARYQMALAEARARYDAAAGAYAERERNRKAALRVKTEDHESYVRRLRETVSRGHREVDALRSGYEAGHPRFVRQYFEAVLSSQHDPDGWPEASRVAFIPEPGEVVVEYDLPGLEIIAEVSEYKYIRSKKEIAPILRTAAERSRLYTSLVTQTSIRVAHILFNADYRAHAESIVFNGHVDSVDEATGRGVRPCLVSFRALRQSFGRLDLMRVDPAKCLCGINGRLSPNPAELKPVAPIVEFDRIDSEFREDGHPHADHRVNLMGLSPREFESLMAKLLECMGMETRQARPSRDGGTDFLAYDPRPILGGKMIIHANRYLSIVNVNAVRDLFGAVQNERATKGILFSTTGFARAAFDFATGKPLELVSGSHLLYMLAYRAGIAAKIEIAGPWKDRAAGRTEIESRSSIAMPLLDVD